MKLRELNNTVNTMSKTFESISNDLHNKKVKNVNKNTNKICAKLDRMIGLLEELIKITDARY